MKKLLFILLIFVSCSKEELSNKDIEHPEKELFAELSVYKTCPERTDMRTYEINKAEWERLQKLIEAMNNKCMELEFKNSAGDNLKGYYAAMVWPSSWN